jgi:hypothetical protein
MIQLDPISILTVRTGKLIAVSLVDNTKHPSEWNWNPNPGGYGMGTRGFMLKQEDLYHQFRLSWDNINKLCDSMNPKKIKGELYECKYGTEIKYHCITFYSKTFVLLKDIYRLYFEDEITKERFQVSNIEILNYI